MSDQYQATYDRLCTHTREAAILNSTQGLLGWDERTKLPPAGGEYRAEQMSYLAGLIHKKQTAPEVGEWLAELIDSPLAADPHSETGADIVNLKRDYDRKTKLPQALVEELAKLSVLGQQMWVEARKANDYARFRPLLERTLELKRQEAAAIGYDEQPYDALLDEYEPGAKTVGSGRGTARASRAARAARGRDRRQFASGRTWKRSRAAIPSICRSKFGKRAIAAIGFDFNAGRLDVTNHPFCGGAGPRDVRLTTRYDERSLDGSFFSTLHEAGHGIYEQGLPADRYGLPTGEAVSLGIHESQSRMWENQVGRSRAFWEYFYPEAQSTFRDALGDVSLDTFYFAINDVRPSLIRTESDEVTYNLHILIRFELELALINDELAGGRFAGSLARQVPRVSWHPIADRRRRRAARRPLELAVHSATSRRIRSATCTPPSSSKRPSKTWEVCRTCSAAASSCRSAIGCEQTSIPKAAATRPPN